MCAVPCMLIVMRRWLPVVEKRRPLSPTRRGVGHTDMCGPAVDLVKNLTDDPGPVASAICQG